MNSERDIVISKLETELLLLEQKSDTIRINVEKMKKERAAVEGTEIAPGIDPVIPTAIGKKTGIEIGIGMGTDLIGIVTGEGDPVLDHVTVMDIADATSIALDHVTANVHAQEIRGVYL